MDYICKTPVALIFFNRPETFRKVFDEVKKVKPTKLFLIQDGARNDADKEKIQKCRKIAESVDWDCEIVRDYSEINLGCGVRPQSGITNAFKTVDKLIILEDDCVPCQSFFRYAEECLEKYKDDERICYISGLNHFEEWETKGNDYFFTKTGAIWGWATWKRAWDKYDYYVSAIEDSKALELAKSRITNKYIRKTRAKSWQKAYESAKNGEKLSYWDNQWGFVKYYYDMLVIVPRVNQIYNIGDGVGSTHAQNSGAGKFIKYKNFFYIPTTEIAEPIKHPETVSCDEKYDALVYKIAAGNPIRRFFVRLIKKILKKR